MKKFIIVFCLVPFLSVIGQQNHCKETAAELQRLVKAEDYEKAYTVITGKANSCLKEEKQIFEDAEKVLLYRLEMAGAEKKAKASDELFTFYEQFEKQVPSSNYAVPVRKAKLMSRYKLAETDDIYKVLERAFRFDNNNFNDPEALYLYYSLFFEKYKKGDSGFKSDDLFIRRDEVVQKLTSLGGSPAETAAKTAIGGINAMLASVVTCETLQSFYGGNFEVRKDDRLWLETASESLISKNCTASADFLKIATRWFDVSPGARSGYALGLAYLRSSRQAKAIAQFNTAADLEKDPAKKAEIYYTLASTLSTSNRSQSADYLKKALQAKADYGKAWLLLAQLYSDSKECAKTPFEAKALNYLAARTVAKAVQAEPALKVTAEAQSAAFLKKAPTKAEIAEAKMGGKKVNFTCWINDSVTVPAAK